MGGNWYSNRATVILVVTEVCQAKFWRVSTGVASPGASLGAEKGGFESDLGNM